MIDPGNLRNSRSTQNSLLFLVIFVILFALYGVKSTFEAPIAVERSVILPTVKRVGFDKIHNENKETIKANLSATQRVANQRPMYNKQQRVKYIEPSDEDDDDALGLWSVNATNETARRKYYMSLSCPQEHLRPGENLPKIALASFPRAGNGWTRHLIQYATGLYVGSEKWAKRKHHTNIETFPASGDDVRNKRVVIIKTHNRASSPLNKEAVLLIRNPYRAIVSDVYKRVLLRQCFSSGEMLAYFKTERWKDDVSRLSRAWSIVAISWIKNATSLLVVAHERLLINTEEELTRIIEFIHQPLREEQIKCAVKAYYPTESSKRFNIDPYTDDMRAIVDSYIREVNDTLIEYKYPTLPTYEKISSY